MSDNDTSSNVTEPFAGLLAEMAISKSNLNQPFGGGDWPQKSGYEIRHEIYRSTKSAILRSVGPETNQSESEQ